MGNTILSLTALATKRCNLEMCGTDPMNVFDNGSWFLKQYHSTKMASLSKPLPWYDATKLRNQLRNQYILGIIPCYY